MISIQLMLVFFLENNSYIIDDELLREAMILKVKYLVELLTTVKKKKAIVLMTMAF